jgi:hypothetical protein
VRLLEAFLIHRLLLLLVTFVVNTIKCPQRKYILQQLISGLLGVVVPLLDGEGLALQGLPDYLGDVSSLIQFAQLILFHNIIITVLE